MKLSDYTFETFIDTPSNHLARLAAQKICETPGVYNPLYIFGPSGTGKVLFVPFGKVQIKIGLVVFILRWSRVQPVNMQILFPIVHSIHLLLA